MTIWFATSRKELEQGILEMARVTECGPLWIAWPKRAAGRKTNLTQQRVRDADLAAGLVDYSFCSIDMTWSGLLFTLRRAKEQRTISGAGGYVARRVGRRSAAARIGGAMGSDIDRFDMLFVVWAFLFQVALIVHFALRKRLIEAYTLKLGWLVYALSIPAAVISVVLLLRGKTWSVWLGGVLFIVYAAYGYWVDYVRGIQWRNPLRPAIMVPYVLLYLATVMFYWWPLGALSRPLWIAFGILFAIGTVLNVTSH
jgi:hypothetical protein